MGSIETTSAPDQMVRSNIPIAPTTYKLSTVDQYVAKKWIVRMLYFALPDDAVATDVYASLKDSLSQVVTMYPQMSGKVIRQPDKNHFVGIQTEEDSAIHFTFKDHTKSEGLRLPPYKKLKEQGYPMQGLVSLVCPDVAQYEISEGSCIFAPQANFIEGGLILTIVFNHVLIDGSWLDEFFRLWSGFGSKSIDPPTAPMSYPADVVERLSKGIDAPSALTAKTWVVGNAAKSDLFLPPPGTPANSVSHPKKQSADAPKLPAGSALRIWTISSEKQKELKALAKAWSTNDSIFALLWQRNIVHAKLKDRDFETLWARMPIDMRSRLTPQVNHTYMGNSVAMLSTEVPAKDIDASDVSTSLPTLAKALRESIKAYSADDFLSWIGTADNLPADKALVYPFPAVFDPCILLNDHSKMKVYTYDWGHSLGYVDRVRDVMDDVPVRHLNLSLIMPKFQDGSLEVVTLLDTDVNSALEKDELFLKYFSLYGNAQLWV